MKRNRKLSALPRIFRATVLFVIFILPAGLFQAIEEFAPGPVSVLASPQRGGGRRTSLKPVKGKQGHPMRPSFKVPRMPPEKGKTIGNIGSRYPKQSGGPARSPSPHWERARSTQSLAQALSNSREPIEVTLNKHPDVQSYIQLPGEKNYLIMVGGSKYLWTVTEGKLPGNLGLLVVNELGAKLSKSGTLIAVPATGKLDNGKVALRITSDPLPRQIVKVTIGSGNEKLAGHADVRAGITYFELGKLPERLKNDPGQLREPSIDIRRRASALHLQRGIRKLDSQLKSGRHDQASRQLNDLIEIHGRRPELTLRKGLIQVGQQAPKVAPIITETVRSTGLRKPKALFDQIGEQIAQSGILPKGESVEFTKEGKRIGVSYHLDRSLVGEPVNPKEIKERTPQVYVQDHPGLNHINWNVSVRKAMATAASRNLGTVIRLTHGDIAQFNPTTILAPNHTSGETIQYKLVRPGRTPKGSGTRPGCPERVIEIGGDETRVIGGSDPCKGPVIYVVRANDLQ